jgi:hypothetical protein
VITRISLWLFVLLSVPLVWSFVHADVFSSPMSRDSSRVVVHVHGTVIFGVADRPAEFFDHRGSWFPGPRAVGGVMWYCFIGDRISTGWDFGGVRYEELSDPAFTDEVAWAYAIPYWPLIILTAVLPAIRLCARSRESKMRASGLCSSCGYDLRATPERCPECGTAPAHAARSATAL